MYFFIKDRETLVSVVDENSSNPFNKWEKLSIMLNNIFEEEVEKDVWRKRYIRARKTLDKMSDPIKNPIDYRKSTIEKSILKQGLNEKAKFSLISDQVIEAVDSWFPKVELNDEFLEEKEREFVFVTSDFHYAGSEDELKEIEKIYQHIISKQIEFGFKKIKLIELGDVVEGSHLRPSQLMFVKKPLIPQIIDIAGEYANMMQRLSEKMHIDFYCVTSSNHTQTRAFQTKQNELVEDDAMLVFAEIIKRSMAKNKNVTFTSGKDFLVDLIGNRKMFVAHGHLIKGKKDGYVQELAMKRGITFDYALFGHFHHYREITLYERPTHNMKIFYAPSLNSTHSDYEHDKNLGSKAGMLMVIFTKDRGHKYSEELFV